MVLVKQRRQVTLAAGTIQLCTAIVTIVHLWAPFEMLACWHPVFCIGVASRERERVQRGQGKTPTEVSTATGQPAARPQRSVRILLIGWDRSQG